MKRIPGPSILFLLFMLACKREEPTTWSTHVLGPIAHGRITLDDIVPDSILQAGEDGLWHLVFHEDLTDFDLDSLVSIPDTVIEKIFDMPGNGGTFAVPNGTLIFEQEENNLLNVNDVELKEVIAKSGKLHYKMKSYINGYLVCTYEMPGVSYNGVGTVIDVITQPSEGDTPYIFEGEIDLAGYHIDLTGENGNMFNRIYSHATIMTSPDSPQQAQISGTDYVVLELSFIEPVIEYARGYFGQHEYNLDHTLDFAGDINMPTGTLNLEDVTMQMHIENNVGVDLQLKLDDLEASNSQTGISVFLDNNELFETINISRAHDNNGSVTGNSYDFNLSGANSNIVEFMENLPDILSLQAMVQVNPLGNISDGNDFIYTTDALSAYIDMDIPLAVGLQNLTLRDTLDIVNSIDLQANGFLTLYVENAFPFQTTVSASLMNGIGDELFVLMPSQQIAFAQQTIEPGLTIPASSSVRIDVPQQAIDLFIDSNFIVITVIFNTPGYPEPVKLYEDYYLDFRLVGDGDIVISAR